MNINSIKKLICETVQNVFSKQDLFGKKFYHGTILENWKQESSDYLFVIDDFNHAKIHANDRAHSAIEEEHKPVTAIVIEIVINDDIINLDWFVDDDNGNWKQYKTWQDSYNEVGSFVIQGHYDINDFKIVYRNVVVSNSMLTESINDLSLPIKKISKVFHVGTMDISKKSSFSLEGSGLSVSVHPEEWQKINPLTAGVLHVLTKNNGQFVDAHRLNKKQKRNIILWGIQNEYIVQKGTYRYYYYDDELEQEVYMEFPTYEEAEKEVDDKSDIKFESKGIFSTEKLFIKTNQSKIYAATTFDLLLTVYVETETEYDGIWWNDKLDVLSYSAPRGVIFNSKLKEWNVTKS